MSYKTYEQFKYNDSTFFPFIPNHWSEYKLKYLIDSLESGKRKDFEDVDYALSIGGEHINWNGTLNLTNRRYISEEFYNSMFKGKIKNNDVLLVKDGATIGKTAFIENFDLKMAANEHVFIIRNNKLIIPKLLYYLISSSIGFNQIKLTETGSAQGGISQDIRDKVFFPIAKNNEEQNKIVLYLDKKTSEIDVSIAKSKELISLLEEKKSALINQVVTKGLNPNVPMKDSGIEWIGEIPEHWAVIPLKRACSKITDGSHHSPETQYEGKYYITVKDVLEKEINFENANKISIDDFNDLKNNSCQPLKGDVLLSKDGTIGKCVVVDYNDFVILSSLGLLRPNILINSNYLRYFLISDINIKQMFSFIRGSALKRLTINIIKELEIILPSLQEQEQIIDYLDKETSKIDKSIKKLENNISLLEEYKDSLIHHAVTGKIDVRDEI